ncbi:HD phosphohydrolase domain-containing protein [Gigaspora margarita]|uniref:HD phosphohydrolase domain-containing protein n=1 Tax=Gigaspora margarita TaxID=4874 RepID=A0A8H4AVF8_GIGMA|nr:HD phosphohydrolase domain-containing protein [Gigaspora margarita]
MSSQKKIINDPIHGYMEFDDLVIKFIDTPQFQRLKEIKQLGSAYFVYPGASHNRFEHSLGTAYLAQKFTKILQQKGAGNSHYAERDLKCVTLAALCHDLGHGPFSHVFDQLVVPKLIPDTKWKHENGSIMMLEDILIELRKTEGDSLKLNENEENLIKALILGKYKSESAGIEIGNMPKYLFDIVNNEDNSVDVDKFDYLNRDCYNLGMKSLFDSSRLMQFSCVIDDSIAYYHKECFSIYEMFHTRYSMHKKVYNHRVSRAINYMIADALVKADPYFKIKDAIINKNAKEYIKLNDSILSTIEHSDCEDLKASRDIIKRIKQRDLYRFVSECSIPKEHKELVTKKKLDDHFAEDSSLSTEIIDDLVIERLGLDYGKGGSNPVEKVIFYDKKERTAKPYTIPRKELSYLVPQEFEDIVLSVFVRTDNEVVTSHILSMPSRIYID